MQRSLPPLVEEPCDMGGSEERAEILENERSQFKLLRSEKHFFASVDLLLGQTAMQKKNNNPK